MSDTLDHVAFLSREIGPRPAGTEEEQQAALYITERLQQDAGLSASIEDFDTASANAQLPHALCGGVMLVFAILAVALPVMAIPSIIVCLLATALIVAEAFDKPILSRLFARGVSQNVVAKYEPGFSAEAGGTRRRKVVLVARYDSGKVRAELNGPVVGFLPQLKWVELGAAVATVLFALIYGVFFLHSTGAPAIVFKVLLVLSAVIAALPLVGIIIHKTAAYNEGANCNASGVAVLMDVATRIGRGRVSEQELAAAEFAQLHGEEAAREAGLVPDGAQIAYETDMPKDPDIPEQSPAERLAAAKAAVAALSGKPVSSGISIDLASNLVQVKESHIAAPTNEEIREMRADALAALSGSVAVDDDVADFADTFIAEETVSDEPALAEAEAPAEVAPAMPPANNGVPAWFKSAQEKAKRKDDNAPIQRSRYADALDAAVRESSEHFENANKAVVSETEMRLQAMRDSIMEVKAPSYARVAGAAAATATAAAEAVETVVEPLTPEDSAPEAAPTTAAFSQLEAEAENTDAAAALASLDAIPATEPEQSEEPLQPLQPFVSTVMENDATQSVDPLLQNTVAMPAVNPITLPSIEQHKQSAPLADDGTAPAKSAAARNLRTLLPSISGTISATPIAAQHPAAMSIDALRTTLPSLSGSISAEALADAETQANEVPADATVALPPFEEVVFNEAIDDFVVDDVDDSAYDGNITETGAFAGPGYVEMPKSRVGGLFGRFRKKKQESETSATEWLNVDESFDARSVGAARGGWESFRQDDAQSAAYVDGQYDDGDFYDEEEQTHNRRGWNGGAFSQRIMMGKGDLSSEEIAAVEEPITPTDEAIDEELGQVYRFRHPEINTEVWFVALGAELDGNAGMAAFLAEHNQDLRGAVIVELDALGAGELSLVAREGAYRSVQTSSRMKRYVKKAAQELGFSVPSAEIRWNDGAAAFAAKRGYQAMHLVGMDGKKPAFCAQQDDVLENIDSELLSLNADFVMSLLKNI